MRERERERYLVDLTISDMLLLLFIIIIIIIILRTKYNLSKVEVNKTNNMLGRLISSNFFFF